MPSVWGGTSSIVRPHYRVNSYSGAYGGYRKRRRTRGRAITARSFGNLVSSLGGRRRRRTRGSGFFGDVWDKIKSGVSAVAPHVLNIGKDLLLSAAKKKLGLGRRRRTRRGRSMGMRRRTRRRTRGGYYTAGGKRRRRTRRKRRTGRGILSTLLGFAGLGKRRRTRRRRGGRRMYG
jgi:hypothetical protein